MRLLSRLVLPIIVAGLVLVSAIPAFALPEEQLWESYTSGDDAGYEVYGNIWLAQTFTTGTEAHSISQVRLLAYREGTPSTITASIKETSAGLPTGDDLTIGTTDADYFTTDTAGVWYTVDLTEYSLEASTTYAIVIRATIGDSTNSLWIRYDGSTATYADGSEINSTNGGISWSADTDDDLLFETWGSSLLEITNAQVFRGYLEDDDMLIVCQYFNTYAPYYPNTDTASYFNIQLRDTAGTTTLAQTSCGAWGYKPGAIYLSADSAASLTSGTAYRVYLYGDFTGNPLDYYTLQSTDWRGDDLTFLDTWVLNAARDIGEYYDTNMTTFLVGDSGQEVLSTEGGIIFNIGIPGLSQVRPDLFELIVDPDAYTATDWTYAFTEETTWDTQLGTTTSTALTSAGTLFGTDGKAIGAFILMAIYLGLAIWVVSRGGNATIAVILAVPFTLLGAWLRLIDIVIIAVVASVAVLMLVFRFWWSRT